MFFYAVAVLPLIRSLASNSYFVQCWYADDSACAGKLSQIRLWLEKLIQLGPAYGYFAEPTKSVLVVAPQFEDVAKNCFKDLGITVSSGHRFLGGVIGTREYCRNFMKQKVEYWTECVTKVSKAAVRALQAAFSTMTKSLQCECEFVQRVVPDCAETFIPLQHAISDQFFPSLLGGVVTVEEKRLFQLPTYLAGLGIYDPTETAVHAYKTSRQGTATVSEAIKGVTAFQHEQHLESLTTARKMSTKAKEDDFVLKFESIIPSFSPDRQRALRRSLNGKTSTWLNVLPLQNYHFDLSPLQFRDGLAIRYLRDPPCLPPKCDGCGTALTLQHALDCKKGGLVIQRHNEIRDCTGDIASQVWTHVIKEPVVREADVKNADGGLRLDLGIRGVWQPQVEALFDVKVVDTDAPSHRTHSPEAILESGAKEKKRVYEQAVVERRGNFTPIVLSVDGLLHREAEHFLKRMAANPAHKWEKPYSQTCGYISFTKFRVKCYDGCSTMAGARAGVAVKIQEVEPRAVLTHFYGHALNLAMSDTITKTAVHEASNTEIKARIRGVWNQMQSFNFLFRIVLSEMVLHHTDKLSQTLQQPKLSSVEGHDMLTEITLQGLRTENDFELFWQKVEKIRIKFDTDEPLLARKRKTPRQFEEGELVGLIENLSDDKTMTHDTRSEAQILLAAILIFEFFVLLHFWNTILGKLDRVQKRLQDPSMNFKDAAADLKDLQHNLATDVEQLCLDAIENAKIRCTDWEIDVERRIRRRRRMPDELSLDAGLSAEQEIKRVLRSIFDRLHQEIVTYFSRLDDMNSKFGFLLDVTNLLSNNDALAHHRHCVELGKIYDTDINGEDLSTEVCDCRMQLNSRGDISPKTPIELLSFIISYGDDVFPNFRIASQISLTIVDANAN
ncbi:hypothetical protein EMCRGX_G006855 [Ephydatia muelleri]